MGSGSPSPKVLAYYDPSSSSWRTSKPSAAADSDEFSVTWPRSGMTRVGRAYELPTLVPPTVGNGSSSWPTTQTADASSTLLPTPNTGDMKSAQPAAVRQAKRHQVRLGDVLVTTPPEGRGCVQAAADAAGTGLVGSTADAKRDGPGAQRLGDTPCAFQWGPYEPAVRRWEGITGRSAPAPVELGTRGQRRLAAPFVEWLMGLPAGYIAGLGLPRSGELRALGNGVVPQQAEEALRWLARASQESAYASKPGPDHLGS